VAVVGDAREAASCPELKGGCRTLRDDADHRREEAAAFPAA
jgi:hypothetical protein